MKTSELTSQLDFIKEVNEVLVALLHDAEKFCGIYIVAAVPCADGIEVRSNYLVGATDPRTQATFAEAVGETTAATLASFFEEA